MNKKLKNLLLLPLLLWAGAFMAQPKPSAAQLAWHDMEFYLFMHFGPNTFTDKEWGLGTEPEDIFNPTELDCRQWCRVARAAGAKGIIITAKHHDGFCLWPSRFSKHTVRESKWKNGKGDVLKELSAACKEYGLKFGVYISPWDRNHPDYGTDKYNAVFVNMMKELFSNYGPIWELWWDGANGEGPNGKKQVYDWALFRETVKKLSPNTVIFSDVGPHIRWVGNENGEAGETNWNTLDTAGFTPGAGAPPQDTLKKGNISGRAWVPAECDVSIRPGWFYHKGEDDKVKTPEKLVELYLKSVGRGSTLLLNVPPDRRGRIHANDSASLVGFNRLLAANFVSDELINEGPVLNNVWAGKSGLDNRTEFRFSSYPDNRPVYLQFNFETPRLINCVILKEVIRYGQAVRLLNLRIEKKDGSVFYRNLTTIGHKRIITFPAVEARTITITVIDAAGDVFLYRPACYLIEGNLTEKRN
ncbi:MAG: alpha-L-fucosidase [Sphingobacteriales bacterium]|nr:alpha-L-fucosidase [Sphingobacteriales bacterium]